MCNIRFNLLIFFYNHVLDVVAEWSKSLDLGSSLHWRGFKSYRYQHIADSYILNMGLKNVCVVIISFLCNLLAYVGFY